MEKLVVVAHALNPMRWNRVVTNVAQLRPLDPGSRLINVEIMPVLESERQNEAS